MQGWRKLPYDLRSAGRKVSVTVGVPRRSWRSEVSFVNIITLFYSVLTEEPQPFQPMLVLSE